MMMMIHTFETYSSNDFIESFKTVFVFNKFILTDESADYFAQIQNYFQADSLKAWRSNSHCIRFLNPNFYYSNQMLQSNEQRKKRKINNNNTTTMKHKYFFARTKSKRYI